MVCIYKFVFSVSFRYCFFISCFNHGGELSYVMENNSVHSTSLNSLLKPRFRYLTAVINGIDWCKSNVTNIDYQFGNDRNKSNLIDDAKLAKIVTLHVYFRSLGSFSLLYIAIGTPNFKVYVSNFFRIEILSYFQEILEDRTIVKFGQLIETSTLSVLSRDILIS